MPAGSAQAMARFTAELAIGRRVAWPNPEALWEKSEAPHLRIVDDRLWYEVKQWQLLIRNSLHGQAGLKAGAARQNLNAKHRSHFRKRSVLLSITHISAHCAAAARIKS